jgi:hypothetical protein
METREVDDNRLGEVLHSGGQSWNYESSNLFIIVTMVNKVRLVLFVSFVWFPW